MLRTYGEILAGVVLFLFTSVFFVQSLGYEYSGDLGPGPGFFPIWISGALGLASIVYTFQSFLKMKKVEGKEEHTPNVHSLKKIAYIIVSMVAYILAISFLGFVLTTTIFLFTLLFKEYKWYTSLGIAIFTSIFLFWLFGALLNVALPVNVFGW